MSGTPAEPPPQRLQGAARAAGSELLQHVARTDSHDGPRAAAIVERPEPNAACRDVGHAQVAGPADQQIDRLGSHCRNHGGDLVARAQPRRVQAVGPCVGIGLQSGDGFLQIGSADQIALGAPHEQRVGARPVNGAPRCAQPFDRFLDAEQRRGRLARRILDRQPGHTRLDRKPHALRHTGRVGGKPALEVGIDRNVRGSDHLREMQQRHLPRDAVVGPRLRPGEPGTGRGQCLEPQALQHPRAADVPGVRDDEAAGFMQATKRLALVGDADQS